MFDLKQVTKTYPLDGTNPVTAVRELSLSVKRGEFLVITGRSGSGKTTVLNLIAGAHPAHRRMCRIGWG